MPAKFFGQFLLERGVISRDVLLDAITYQKSIHQPLCALALEKGYLTPVQLEELDADHKESDKKFLELAVKKNMLRFEQLEELGKLQSERWMFLGEALVEKGHLSLVKLQELLEEYRKEQQIKDTDLDTVLADVPEKDVISSFLQLTVDLFLHYTKQIVEVISVEKTDFDPKGISYIFSQHVTGDKNFHYALALPEALTLSIASYILREEIKEMCDTVLDAVSEFVNVVIGNGCTRLSMKDFTVSAEPPRIVTKEMIKKLLPAEVIAVRMKTVKGEFEIMFFFSTNNKTEE